MSIEGYTSLVLWLSPALLFSIIVLFQEGFGDPWWMKPALILFFLTWPISIVLAFLGTVLKYYTTNKEERNVR